MYISLIVYSWLVLKISIEDLIHSDHEIHVRKLMFDILVVYIIYTNVATNKSYTNGYMHKTVLHRTNDYGIANAITALI